MNIETRTYALRYQRRKLIGLVISNNIVQLARERERANAVPCVPPPTGVISFSAQDGAHSRNKLLADDSSDITLHTHRLATDKSSGHIPMAGQYGGS
jgi:hypothetical protein